MKTNMRSWTKAVALLASVAALSVTAQAGIVYDNSTTTTGQFYASTNEFGDQIKLAGNPKERTITEFRFDYYLSHAVNGDEKGQLRLYDNTGPSGAPGALLYESDIFPLRVGYNSVDITGLSVNAPDDITFTVQFTGVEGNETAGLLFYDPPTVGTSLDDYWEKIGGTFVGQRFTGGPVANFGAQVIAVPEPSTVVLGLLGAAALLIRRRK